MSIDLRWGHKSMSIETILHTLYSYTFIILLPNLNTRINQPTNQQTPTPPLLRRDVLVPRLAECRDGRALRRLGAARGGRGAAAGGLGAAEDGAVGNPCGGQVGRWGRRSLEGDGRMFSVFW